MSSILCRTLMKQRYDYKKQKRRGEYAPCFPQNPLNQLCDMGIQEPEPYHGGDAPEKAVQQIDPAAQIETDAAVIPEHFAKYNFRKHAAGIFISAAQKGAYQEEAGFSFVPIPIQQGRDQGDGQPPYHAEGPLHQAAPAHPYSHGDTAE